MKFISKIEDLSRKIRLYPLFVCLGLLNGPMALTSAQSAIPPIDSKSLILMFVAAAIGIVFVLGIQVAASNKGGLQSGWKFFYCASAFLIGSGVSSLFVAFFRNEVGPPAFMFLCLAAGLSLGVVIMNPANRKTGDS